jgi:UDP-N-acetylmuramyl pentapeptide phosphotransferase/UDP-N-acetylglucosamine-1-phosphate transferase
LNPALALALTALLSLGLAEAWRRWALRRGVIDVPGQRSSHAQPTPRGAGIGLVLALLAGMLAVLPASVARDAAMASIALAAALGLLDDLRPLPPLLKLAGQGLASLPLALALPFPLPVALVGVPEPVIGLLGSGAAVATGVLLQNAWNFMDGINGIASLAACAVAIVVLAMQGPAAPLALLLLAACLGFLPLNFPRARVFMGDCGSHGLGMAITALLLWPAALPATLAAAAAASPFVVDVLGTLARRAREGERLTLAHRRHLYQLAVRTGYSHARVALAYLAWMVASGACVATLGVGDTRARLLAMLVLGANAGLWWVATDRFERRLRKEGRW